MNLVISFLDGYVDSGARCADCERLRWDADYRDGYLQRIKDEDAELAEWVADEEEAEPVFTWEFEDEPGYRTSWNTF